MGVVETWRRDGAPGFRGEVQPDGSIIERAITIAPTDPLFNLALAEAAEAAGIEVDDDAEGGQGGAGLGADDEFEHELPEWMGAALHEAQGLEKGIGHRYIRRVPKPGGGYRYFYKVTGGAGGVGHESEMVVGAAFRVNTPGKEGHFHIVSDGSDMAAAPPGEVFVRHDETGEATWIPKAALSAMLRAQHAQALDAHKSKLATDMTDAEKSGASEKQKARLAAEAAKYGVEAPKASATAGPKFTPIGEAKKGDLVEVTYKGEKVTGKVVRIDAKGTATVDVEKTKDNPGGHSDADVALIEVKTGAKSAPFDPKKLKAYPPGVAIHTADGKPIFHRDSAGQWRDSDGIKRSAAHVAHITSLYGDMMGPFTVAYDDKTAAAPETKAPSVEETSEALAAKADKKIAAKEKAADEAKAAKAAKKAADEAVHQAQVKQSKELLDSAHAVDEAANKAKAIATGGFVAGTTLWDAKGEQHKIPFEDSALHLLSPGNPNQITPEQLKAYHADLVDKHNRKAAFDPKRHKYLVSVRGDDGTATAHFFGKQQDAKAHLDKARQGLAYGGAKGVGMGKVPAVETAEAIHQMLLDHHKLQGKPVKSVVFHDGDAGKAAAGPTEKPKPKVKKVVSPAPPPPPAGEAFPKPETWTHPDGYPRTSHFDAATDHHVNMAAAHKAVAKTLPKNSPERFKHLAAADIHSDTANEWFLARKGVTKIAGFSPEQVKQRVASLLSQSKGANSYSDKMNGHGKQDNSGHDFPDPKNDGIGTVYKGPSGTITKVEGGYKDASGLTHPDLGAFGNMNSFKVTTRKSMTDGGAGLEKAMSAKDHTLAQAQHEAHHLQAAADGDLKAAAEHSRAAKKHAKAAAAVDGGKKNASRASLQAVEATRALGKKAATPARAPASESQAPAPAKAPSVPAAGAPAGGQSKEGLPVIAVGPRGGKIVGYTQKAGKQVAIYEGSQAASKLAAAKGAGGAPAAAKSDPAEDGAAAQPEAPKDERAAKAGGNQQIGDAIGKLHDAAQEHVSAAQSGDAGRQKRAKAALKAAHAETQSAITAAATTPPPAEPVPDPSVDAAGQPVAGGGQPEPAPAPAEPKDTAPISPDAPPGGTPADAPDPAALGSASPPTDSAEARHQQEVAKMKGDLEAAYKRLDALQHHIDAELVPLFNRLKSDARRAHQSPSKNVVTWLLSRVARFAAMVLGLHEDKGKLPTAELPADPRGKRVAGKAHAAKSGGGSMRKSLMALPDFVEALDTYRACLPGRGGRVAANVDTAPLRKASNASPDPVGDEAAGLMLEALDEAIPAPGRFIAVAIRGDQRREQLAQAAELMLAGG